MTLMDVVSALLRLYPLNKNDTDHFLSSDNGYSFLYYQVYVVFIIGLPLNLLVSYISFFDKSIKNNYKYLLGNIAICDILLLCGLLNYNLVNKYVVENFQKYTPFYCTLNQAWSQTFSVCYFNAQPLVSIHRYMCIVRQKENFFTNKTILCLCLLVYWPILYPILAFAHPTHLVMNYFCGYMYWFPFIREFMLIPAVILNLISVFCMVKLFVFIREHIKKATINIDRSKLIDERSLLKAITLQAIIPIISSIPIVITFILSNLWRDLWNTIDRKWYIFGIAIDSPFMNISMAIYELCPALDPLLTMFCVRQYRRIITNWYRKCVNSKNTTSVRAIARREV